MKERVTLKDEYEMLVGELRQNRQIQLQTFLSTLITISGFLCVLWWIIHLGVIKSKLIKAWEITLSGKRGIKA